MGPVRRKYVDKSVENNHVIIDREPFLITKSRNGIFLDRNFSTKWGEVVIRCWNCSKFWSKIVWASSSADILWIQSLISIDGGVPDQNLVLEDWNLKAAHPDGRSALWLIPSSYRAAKPHISYFLPSDTHSKENPI